MRPASHSAVALVLVIVSLVGFVVPSEAGVRVGGGMGIVADERAPMGRLVVDILPLWFIAVSLDTEIWLRSRDQQWLFPFATVSTPLIFQATVGVAPFIARSSEGVAVAANTAVLKGGLGTAVGPLGLFGEVLFFIAPSEGVPESIPELGRPIFAVGLTIGF